MLGVSFSPVPECVVIALLEPSFSDPSYHQSPVIVIVIVVIIIVVLNLAGCCYYCLYLTK